MTQTLIFTVTGMKCGGCENKLISQLATLAGVVSTQADHKQNQVTIEFDPQQTDSDTLEEAIIAAGFDVE